MSSDTVAHARTDVESDASLLEALQERMEKIARGEAPNTGRFCGICYARLNREETACRLCGTLTRDTAPVESVPREVLLVYMQHWRKMRLWVNVFAFLGIFIAIVLAGLVFAFFPSFTKLLAVPVMVGGAWYFANLLGGGLGGALGMRTGAAARLRAWRAYQHGRARAADEAPHTAQTSRLT